MLLYSGFWLKLTEISFIICSQCVFASIFSFFILVFKVQLCLLLKKLAYWPYRLSKTFSRYNPINSYSYRGMLARYAISGMYRVGKLGGYKPLFDLFIEITCEITGFKRLPSPLWWKYIAVPPASSFSCRYTLYVLRMIHTMREVSLLSLHEGKSPLLTAEISLNPRN